MKIISNYALERTAEASATIPKESLGGEEVVDRVVWAYKLAAADVYRAVTHNKGVMNGVTALVLATGNDTRAVEAGCHSFACRSGRYTSLTKWAKNIAKLASGKKAAYIYFNNDAEAFALQNALMLERKLKAT